MKKSLKNLRMRNKEYKAKIEQEFKDKFEKYKQKLDFEYESKLLESIQNIHEDVKSDYERQLKSEKAKVKRKTPIIKNKNIGMK